MTLASPPLRTIAILCFLAFLVALWSYSPSSDPEGYLHFARGTDLPGLPHSANVLTNLPFLLVGLWGIRNGPRRSAAALMFSAGLVLTAIGSSLFHVEPTDASLFWDRVPMVITFMSLLAYLVTDRILPGREKWILWPLLAAGIASLIEWRYGGGDLRPYIVVQYGGIVALLLIAAVFPARRLSNRAIYGALGFYILAKVVEVNDVAIFLATSEALSGHAAKHLAAAAGAVILVSGLKTIHEPGA